MDADRLACGFALSIGAVSFDGNFFLLLKSFALLRLHAFIGELGLKVDSFVWKSVNT